MWSRVTPWSRSFASNARIIFGLSVIPNPLTTFATVTASAVGVSFTHFFAASLAGFLVLTSALVILGQGMLQALRVTS